MNSSISLIKLCDYAKSIEVSDSDKYEALVKRINTLVCRHRYRLANHCTDRDDVLTYCFRIKHTYTRDMIFNIIEQIACDSCAVDQFRPWTQFKIRNEQN